MRKGLFWIVPVEFDSKNNPSPHTLNAVIDYSAICDENGVITEDQPPYNSKKGNSYSHEHSWSLVNEGLPKKSREKSWNYYPRGRVEIANGKATVYFNPVLLDTGFEPHIKYIFELSEIPIRFIPDFSNHYKCNDGDYDE